LINDYELIKFSIEVDFIGIFTSSQNIKLIVKMVKMGSLKKAGQKKKLIAIRKQNAPRWADIRKYNLKRARSRRIRVITKHWRHGRIKV
jgi:hypothetical protein